MFSHDATLIAPTSSELAAALSAAIRAANKGCRKNRLSDPPPLYDHFIRDHLTQPEGGAFWLSNADAQPPTACTRVALVWWTDRAGRRHYRIASVRGGWGRYWRLSDLLAGEPEERFPLLRIDPHVFHRVRQGQTEMIALCGCGVHGPPESIAWMGERCGPCHDRFESAAPLPPRHAWVWQGTDWDGRCLAFSPDGAWLAAGGNSRLRLFETATGACRVLELPNENTLSVAFSPDGRTLAAGRWNGDVLLVDPATDRTKPQGRLHNPFTDQCVWDVHFSPANDRVFARSVNLLLSWDLATGQGGSLPHPFSEIYHLALSPDGHTLAAGDRDGTIHLLDLDSATWKPLGDFGAERPGSLAFSADSQTLACCCAGYRSHVVLVEVSTRRVLRTDPETEFDPIQSGWNLAFTPDGRTLLTTIECCVQARDAATGAMLSRLDLLDENMQSLAVSPTGTHLAVSSYSGTIRLLPIELFRED